MTARVTVTGGNCGCALGIPNCTLGCDIGHLMGHMGSDGVVSGGEVSGKVLQLAVIQSDGFNSGGEVAMKESTPTYAGSRAGLSGGEVSGSVDAANAVVTAAPGATKHNYHRFASKPRTVHQVDVLDRDGVLKWSDRLENLVTTEGLNALLDATFKTGNASPAWFVGLVDGATEPAYNEADTMASHAGWHEATGYSDETRPAFTPGTIAQGSVDNSASKAKFHITGEDATIAGFFITTGSAINGTSGTLYGVGALLSGPRPVGDGDTLNVTSTISVGEDA